VSAAPTASAGAVAGPLPIASIEPHFNTLQFSDDEVWSALVVELQPSREHAVAIVEERGGVRRLVRLVGRGKEGLWTPVFLASRRLLVPGDGVVTIVDLAAGRELEVPSATRDKGLVQGSRWVTIAPDGEVIVVDVEALAIASRLRFPGIGRGGSHHLSEGGRLQLHDERLLVVADVQSGRELLRLDRVFGYALHGDVVAAVLKGDDPGWTVALFDLATSRRIGEHTVFERLAHRPEVDFSRDGRSLLVASLGEGRSGHEQLRLDRLDVSPFAVRLTRRLRPRWTAEADRMFPRLLDDGRVCLTPRYTSKQFALEHELAYDLRRGVEMAPSPAVDHLCSAAGVVELPAALRGPGRRVVPSVRFYGMLGGGLNNGAAGPRGLWARVETDRPRGDGHRFIGARPSLAILDIEKKKKLGELALPEPTVGQASSVDLEFSRDGGRLAACWNGVLFVVDVATRAVVGTPGVCNGSFRFSPQGRYVRQEGRVVDAGTGNALEGPWWGSSAVATGGP
jgi:hypothetical protein